METTVFELAGQDRAGMLADITDLLSANDCTVRSAAVSGLTAGGNRSKEFWEDFYSETSACC